MPILHVDPDAGMTPLGTGPRVPPVSVSTRRARLTGLRAAHGTAPAAAPTAALAAAGSLAATATVPRPRTAAALTATGTLAGVAARGTAVLTGGGTLAAAAVSTRRARLTGLRATAGAAPTGGTITHGRDLTPANVGPTGLGVTTGQLQAMPVPARGYFRQDEPTDWAVTTPYVYSNASTNRGGIVPAGGLTIDGVTYPAGTYVIQFRDFSGAQASFYCSNATPLLFRGCRWRGPNLAPGFFNTQAAMTGALSLHYCDMGGAGAANADYNEVIFKATNGGGGTLLRNYFTYTTTAIQINHDGYDVIENYVDKLTYYYGPNPPPGESTDKHINGLTLNGGQLCVRILRNRVTGPNPDDAGRAIIQTDCISFFQDDPAGFPGTGTNSDGTRGYQVLDNYVGGTGYPIYAGLNAGKAASTVNNMVLTGNEITTQWWPSGGANGPIAAEPAWGTQGNTKANNTWADGPNVGQPAF